MEIITKKHIGLLHILIATALLISTPQVSYSSQNWQTLITALAGTTAKNKLTIGQNEEATDGMDNFYDVTGMLSGDIVAYLQSPKGGLWQEIKGTGLNKSWTMKISSVLTGKQIKITLDRSRVPAGYTIYLHDNNDGSTTNLTQKGDYSYTNNGERTFTIESVGLAGGEDSEGSTVADPADEEIIITEAPETSGEDATYIHNTTARLQEKRITNKRTPAAGDQPYSTDNRTVSEEYESYYKPSTKKLSEQIAGKLKEPSNLRGWIKNKKGLYLEWDDKSKGEHGFIVEKKCDGKKNWSLIAALWGVRPTYTNKKTTIKSSGSCQYRVIAFNHLTESNYSDSVTFSPLGEIEIIEKKVPTAPDKKTTAPTLKTKEIQKR